MKREWQADELVELWTLGPLERELLGNKNGTTRLGFALLLKFHQHEHRFPHHAGEIPALVVDFVAAQVKVPAEHWKQYPWRSRTVEYHRAQIRQFLDYREATIEDAEALSLWLQEHWAPRDRHSDPLKAAVLERCRELRIEPPSPERVERIVRSALHCFEERFCLLVYEQLSAATRAQLNALLPPRTGSAESDGAAGPAPLHDLRTDPGPANLQTVEEELAKLERIRQLALPANLFGSLSPKIQEDYRRRVAVEEIHELRRHPDAVRATLLAAYCQLRSQDLTDTLVDLLLAMVHKVTTRAEKRVEAQLVQERKKVSGKHTILFRLAKAALAQPDGIVQEVLFPVVGEGTLRDVVREFEETGPLYREQLQRVVRNAYRSHYRRMLTRLLTTLTFQATSDRHQTLLEGLALVQKHAGSRSKLYPVEESVPLAGVVQQHWENVVFEKDRQGQARVNRISYELCVLEALRERLRCKEVWVGGANRYRHPDEDLPRDFATARSQYYAALRLPQEAKLFLRDIRQELEEDLARLDRGLPKNKGVQILPQGKGWIKVSPLPAQAEPQNLRALKAEILRRWSMVGLLDIFKETELRVGLTPVFHSATAWERLEREMLRERLLLTLYGIGTNTGLKRIVAGQRNVQYKDLLYVRRRYVTKEQLREAIRLVVNAIFAARDTRLWGEGTTACASDSKKFGAWDQNLMTEWHARYGGPGVMVYWHVEKKSTCIYSQLKTCSSSEVAAMIEGVLRHCTTMAVDRQYVDTHGQSEVGFAFCRLLGFQLLPRLKAIHAQKLYRPEAGRTYPHLQPALARSLDWSLMENQYDSMVEYTVALKTGTAPAEDILRRFTRENTQHPTYKALSELGKACKTVFLCRYLSSPSYGAKFTKGCR